MTHIPEDSPKPDKDEDFEVNADLLIKIRTLKEELYTIPLHKSYTDLIFTIEKMKSDARNKLVEEFLRREMKKLGYKDEDFKIVFKEE